MHEVIAWALLEGCVKNPVTGRLQLDLMGEDTEIQYGNAADEAFVKEIGLYPDEALAAAVTKLGGELAAVSERPSLPWTFRVLDDATVNAFAVPGGHVYVTRGLLAHLAGTDQLAVVLGHETGHVAARHSVTQLSEGVLLGLGVGAVGVLDPHQRHVGGLAARGAESLFLSFGRNDELAADEIGVRYVAGIGRDPRAFLPVFDMLQRVEDASTGGERLPTRLRTHPQSADCYALVASLTGEASASTSPDEPWYELIDGLVVGPNPREGFFVGRSYLHPGLGFRLDLPEGWKGVNERAAMLASPPSEDALLQLSLSTAKSAAEGLAAFAETVGHEGELPTDPSAGLAFSISGEAELQGVVAYVERAGSVFELIGLAPADAWPTHEAQVRASLASYGDLTDPEVLGVQPMRLEVEILEAASTLRALQEAAPSSLPLEALATLNQLDPDAPLPVGQPVKRVTGFNPETAPAQWGR